MGVPRIQAGCYTAQYCADSSIVLIGINYVHLCDLSTSKNGIIPKLFEYTLTLMCKNA